MCRAAVRIGTKQCKAGVVTTPALQVVGLKLVVALGCCKDCIENSTFWWALHTQKGNSRTYCREGKPEAMQNTHLQSPQQ